MALNGSSRKERFFRIFLKLFYYLRSIKLVASKMHVNHSKINPELTRRMELKSRKHCNERKLMISEVEE